MGSGSILVPDYKEHPLLGDPITDDPIRSGPIFEASWTHALHCVSLSNFNSFCKGSNSDVDIVILHG